MKIAKSLRKFAPYVLAYLIFELLFKYLLCFEALELHDYKLFVLLIVPNLLMLGFYISLIRLSRNTNLKEMLRFSRWFLYLSIAFFITFVLSLVLIIYYANFTFNMD